MLSLKPCAHLELPSSLVFAACPPNRNHSKSDQVRSPEHPCQASFQSDVKALSTPLADSYLHGFAENYQSMMDEQDRD